VDVAPVDAVTGMRCDPCHQVKIPGARVSAAAPALSGQANALPVGDPGRDGDVVLAWSGGPGERDVPTPAPVGLLHAQNQFGFLIGAGDWPGSAPRAEQAAEQIVQVDAGVAVLPVCAEGRFSGTPTGSPETPPPLRTTARPAGSDGLLVPFRNPTEVRTETVVTRTCLGILENLVRLVDLLKPFLRVGVLVDVGMVPAGELTVGLLYVVGRRVTGDSKHLVVVAGHAPSPLTAGDHHRGGAELLRTVAVARAYDLQHRARGSVAVRHHADGIVLLRVERHSSLVVSWIAKGGKQANRLVAYRPHAVDDGFGVGIGVGQGAVEVVHHRQPGRGDPGPLGGPLLGELLCAALTGVVGVG
jgi:hypothetical protein